jgi:hypothetical protein
MKKPFRIRTVAAVFPRIFPALFAAALSLCGVRTIVASVATKSESRRPVKRAAAFFSGD